MSVNKRLKGLVGEWTGTNKLHVPWTEVPLRESASTATVGTKMNGQFLAVEYTWSYEGEPQEGMIVLGCDRDSTEVQAVWSDSWHSKDVLMLCNGEISPDGSVSVFGHYSVPDNPDWGWRTEIIPRENSFRYVMYNISPEGKEDIAVETDFERV